MPARFLHSDLIMIKQLVFDMIGMCGNMASVHEDVLWSSHTLIGYMWFRRMIDVEYMVPAPHWHTTRDMAMHLDTPQVRESSFNAACDADLSEPARRAAATCVLVDIYFTYELNDYYSGHPTFRLSRVSNFLSILSDHEGVNYELVMITAINTVTPPDGWDEVLCDELDLVLAHSAAKTARGRRLAPSLADVSNTWNMLYGTTWIRRRIMFLNRDRVMAATGFSAADIVRTWPNNERDNRP